jgi:hypothetical protein
MATPTERDGLDYSREPELAVSALIQMLARFPAVRCERMAHSIIDHCEYIARDERYSLYLRETALNVYQEWRLRLLPAADAAGGRNVH